MRERVLTATGALRFWWSVAMVLVAALLMAGAGIAYTGYAQRQSDRRWCELLATLDQPGQPPSTERGREIQRQIHDLREDLGCSG